MPLKTKSILKTNEEFNQNLINTVFAFIFLYKFLVYEIF